VLTADAGVGKIGSCSFLALARVRAVIRVSRRQVADQVSGDVGVRRGLWINPARAILANDIPAEDDLIPAPGAVRDGRTRAFLNDQPVAVQVLSQASAAPGLNPCPA